MNHRISKTQIDQLGVRLRVGSPQEVDIRMLDDYRRSFSSAYETVVHTIVDKVKLQATGRPAKSTTSIIEELQRETIRLSQVQDIAGCRVLVRSMSHQDRVIARLTKLFADITLMSLIVVDVLATGIARST
jgi:putative GTP pyrophosphokinase